MVQPDRPQVTVWRMRFPCRISKAANTQSEYVTLISFRLQQWLHKHASLLRYTNIACIVCVVLCAGRKLETSPSPLV